jgi:ATP-dependent Clp protease ATP-binding subunit ClpB
VLFDEIEKAHPEVFNVLLQILDDGRMTDGMGRTVDFKNAIIIMTSNVGSRWIQDLGTTERNEMERKVTEVLRATFKPEFLNRIDETIIFESLSPHQIGQIVDIQIERLGTRLADLNLTLELSHEAREYIASAGYDSIYGARPLKRVIQQEIENLLSIEILKGNIREGDHLRAEVDEGKIVLRSVSE